LLDLLLSSHVLGLVIKTTANDFACRHLRLHGQHPCDAPLPLHVSPHSA
jgi:hypothetical protein